MSIPILRPRQSAADRDYMKYRRETREALLMAFVKPYAIVQDGIALMREYAATVKPYFVGEPPCRRENRDDG